MPINVVRVAPGARFNLLLSGKVDILADIFMTNEYPVLMGKGQKLNTPKVGARVRRNSGATRIFIASSTRFATCFTKPASSEVTAPR
jgi:hypothetical protein